MTIYRVFDGVYLMYNDFHMSRCYSRFNSNLRLFCIDHCREGRVEHRTDIVGPSGGGKTTLCHLIARFWDVDKGSVKLGGMDVKEYSMDSLMRNFSFVFQNVYLFQDTIANNIRFGQPDAPIIILDEATANVDPESEQELTTAIEALTKEKTILMIAHRLKTVRHADNILVIDGGKVAQSGTHEQLMQQGGIYRRFVESRELAVGWKV